MPNYDYRRKYKKPSDQRKFISSDEERCAGCDSGSDVRRSCCIRSEEYKNSACPHGVDCWKCVGNVSHCRCAKLGGDINCKNNNGNWKWGNKQTCNECACDDGENNWQVTEGCRDFLYDYGNKSLPSSENHLYVPYTTLNNNDKCKCGCDPEQVSGYGCNGSSENDETSAKSHAGGVAPVSVKFLRSKKYEDRSWSVWDKYSERFRFLNMSSVSSAGEQKVKWNYFVKRFVGDTLHKKGKSGRGLVGSTRFDERDLKLRFTHLPGTELPIQPRFSKLKGGKRFSDSVWDRASTGTAQDVVNNITDIPFSSSTTSGYGDIIIPVNMNYRGKLKILVFKVDLYVSSTGEKLNRYSHESYSGKSATDENKNNAFIGYQDCHYSKNECFNYETSWDWVAVICNGLDK